MLFKVQNPHGGKTEPSWGKNKNISGTHLKCYGVQLVVFFSTKLHRHT